MSSDLRNHMLPRHLEDVLYLRVNCHLWNEVTIQMIMGRPQPAPVVEVGEVQEANYVLVIIEIIIARGCNNCN